METMIIVPGGLLWWACAIYLVSAIIGTIVGIIAITGTLLSG